MNIGSSIRNFRAADELRNITLSPWGAPVAVHPRILKCKSGLTSPPLDSANPPQTRPKGASKVGASSKPTTAPLKMLAADNACDGTSAPPAVQRITRSFLSPLHRLKCHQEIGQPCNRRSRIVRQRLRSELVSKMTTPALKWWRRFSWRNRRGSNSRPFLCAQTIKD